jgi:hypothetical protein
MASRAAIVARLVVHLRGCYQQKPIIATGHLFKLKSGRTSAPRLPLSVSVIQSRAQPSYARIEPGRKVLSRESPIITFELTDKLAKVRGHIWLYAKEALQTLPYLSANGLIVFCVNDAHVCTPMRATARAVSTVWQLALASVPCSILSPIGLDRVRQKNAGAKKRDDGHY